MPRRSVAPPGALPGPPELVIRVPLEGSGEMMLSAQTHEDEVRLRRWLRRSMAVHALPELLTQLLDDLDRADQQEAA
jgi:hypothetical protein